MDEKPLLNVPPRPKNSNSGGQDQGKQNNLFENITNHVSKTLQLLPNTHSADYQANKRLQQKARRLLKRAKVSPA